MNNISANIDNIFLDINQIIEEYSVNKNITLIAVSKKKSVEAIKIAYESGQRDFGENYLQESVEKIKALKDLNINYLTVHISSGLAALKAVKKASKSNTKIVGVTTLTSLNNKDLKLVGYNKSIKNLVVHQAKLAKKANLDAIVCSAQEVKIVKKIFKKEIITPGIRINSKTDDQKRVLTPKQAFKNGAHSLVIGRNITKGDIKKNIQTLIDHLNQ